MKVYRSLLVGLSLILGVRAQIPASNPLDSLISQGKTAADAGAAQGKAAGESAIGEASKLLPKQPELPTNSDPSELKELAQNLIKPGVETKPNQPFELDCPEGEVIDSIKSRKITVDGLTDIVFLFTTKKVIKSKSVTTSKKRVPNGQQGCFQGEYLCGLLSKKVDGKRRFAAQCCKSDHVKSAKSAKTVEKRVKITDAANEIKSDSSESSMSNVIMTESEVICFYSQYEYSESKVTETSENNSEDEVYKKEVKVQREISTSSSSKNSSSSSSTSSSSSSSNSISEKKSGSGEDIDGEKCNNGKGKGKGHCKNHKKGGKSSKEGSGEKGGKHKRKDQEQKNTKSSKTSSSSTSETSKSSNSSTHKTESSDSSSSSSSSASESSKSSKSSGEDKSGEKCNHGNGKGKGPCKNHKKGGKSSEEAHKQKKKSSTESKSHKTESSKSSSTSKSSKSSTSESSSSSSSSSNSKTSKNEMKESKSSFTEEEIKEISKNEIKSGQESKPNQPFKYECAEDEVIESVTTRKVTEKGQSDIIFIFTSKKIAKSQKFKSTRRVVKGGSKHGCHAREYVCGIFSKKSDGKRGYTVECCKSPNVKKSKSSKIVKKTTKITEKGEIAQSDSSDMSLVNMMITESEVTTFYQKYEYSSSKVSSGEDDKSFEKLSAGEGQTTKKAGGEGQTTKKPGSGEKTTTNQS